MEIVDESVESIFAIRPVLAPTVKQDGSPRGRHSKRFRGHALVGDRTWGGGLFREALSWHKAMRPAASPMRDYLSWHDEYDDPASPLTLRLGWPGQA